jgi:hypothetical protein
MATLDSVQMQLGDDNEKYFFCQSGANQGAPHSWIYRTPRPGTYRCVRCLVEFTKVEMQVHTD